MSDAAHATRRFFWLN